MRYFFVFYFEQNPEKDSAEKTAQNFRSNFSAFADKRNGQNWTKGGYFKSWFFPSEAEKNKKGDKAERDVEKRESGKSSYFPNKKKCYSRSPVVIDEREVWIGVGIEISIQSFEILEKQLSVLDMSSSIGRGEINSLE